MWTEVSLQYDRQTVWMNVKEALIMAEVIFDTVEPEAKASCVSLDGLKRLYELKMISEPLPKGWQKHVWEYLKRKSDSVRRKQEELEKLKKQYMEAVALAQSLYVDREKT